MPLLRAFVFLLLTPILTGFCFVVCLVGLLPAPRSGRIAHASARAWARTMLWAAGARIVVTGTEHLSPDEPRVIVSNHASYLDIPAVLWAFPGQLRIIARRNLIWLPFIGWYILLAGHFFIDRDDPRQALGLMERAAARMRRHRLSALIFPEGTRSRDGRLAALKPGAFHLAGTIGVAIQPAAILGTRPILPKEQWAPRRGGVVEVRFGPAIPTAGRSGAPARRALASETRAAFLALGVPDGVPAPPDAPPAPPASSA